MKHQVATSLEDAEMERVNAIVEKLHVSEAWVLRRAVLRGLADVEREVLGSSPAPTASPAANEPIMGQQVVMKPTKGQVAA